MHANASIVPEASLLIGPLVLGGNPGAEQGILIHEANVTWLQGCICQFDNADGNPSYRAMNEIMGELNTHGRGRASLFVIV